MFKYTVAMSMSQMIGEMARLVLTIGQSCEFFIGAI